MEIKTHYKVTKIVDGDSIIVQHLFDKQEIEIRLYGIDAPESKRCSKLIQDERETHIAGEFLIFLGIQATLFLRSILPIGINCTLLQEPKNTIDIYGRTLAYMQLPNGDEVNKQMIEYGFAKPYEKCYFEKLNEYQRLNLIARSQKRGLYQFTKTF